MPLTKVLHLKSAVTALPDGTIIGYPPLVDDTAIFPHFLAVPEESGAHVVLPRRTTACSWPPTARRPSRCSTTSATRSSTVDISEFQKLEGCVTCLSVRLRTVWR